MPIGGGETYNMQTDWRKKEEEEQTPYYYLQCVEKTPPVWLTCLLDLVEEGRDC